jgi:FkbM family methyltransferase
MLRRLRLRNTRANTENTIGETSRREQFWEEAQLRTPIVALDTAPDGVRFVVDTADQVLGRSLFVNRRRAEMGVLEQVMARLDSWGIGDRARSGTFLDVGANIGTTTLMAVCVHGFADAVAIEPEPSNVALLHANSAINDVSGHVRVLPLAASDRSGRVGLARHATNFGDHRVMLSHRADGPELLDVPRSSLDDLVASGLLDPNRIGLVWVDVQGHEGRVLAGATAILERRLPVVLELAPQLLVPSNGLDLLIRFASRHYDQVIDLRARAPEAWREGQAPDRLAELATFYSDDAPGHGHVTDLLLVPGDAG